MMGAAEIFVGLMLVVALLALMARKVSIPYPVLFVLGGLVLGLIPKLPRVGLDPSGCGRPGSPRHPACEEVRCGHPLALVVQGVTLFPAVSPRPPSIGLDAPRPHGKRGEWNHHDNQARDPRIPALLTPRPCG